MYDAWEGWLCPGGDAMFPPEGTPRPAAELLPEKIQGLPDGELLRLQEAAEGTLLNMGFTS